MKSIRRGILGTFAPWSIVGSLFLGGVAFAAANDQASRIFNRLAGYNLSSTDTRRGQMLTYINNGQLIDAARIATSDPGFYNVTMRQFAAPLSNRGEAAQVPLNDFIAMFVGVTRDNRDARELLYGDFLYVGNSNDSAYRTACKNNGPCTYTPDISTVVSQLHFQALDGLDLSKYLVRISPQRPDLKDAAGVLTSYAWASAHFTGGTNRRATEFAFREFLCTSIKELSDTSLNDFRVRRDVDRAPGGNAATYQNTCKGCHAGLDSISGAWGYFNYSTQNPLENQVLVTKYNQNSTVYPNGYVSKDNSWINQFTKNQNAALQWRGEMTGNGVAAFGKMLANSGAFSRCMAKRAFRKVCSRDASSSESQVIEDLKAKFESSNYNLRVLMEEAAIVPACLGN